VEISVKRMLRTRGAAVAGVTALAVGLTLVVGRLLLQLISLISPDIVLYGSSFNPMPVLAYPGFATALLLEVLPFSLGYFLGLWVVAPITGELRVGHVITRAILATGIGSTLLFVSLGLAGSLIASVTDPGGASTGLIAQQLGFALQTALTAFVTRLPLGVLAGVLLWLWRAAHPAPHHIGGLIDEV
jgi:hypothetical protein